MHKKIKILYNKNLMNCVWIVRNQKKTINYLKYIDFLKYVYNINNGKNKIINGKKQQIKAILKLIIVIDNLYHKHNIVFTKAKKS